MTDDTTDAVLALIDSAVRDRSTGPDAVRYNPQSGPFAATGKPRMYLGDGTEIPVISFEWTERPVLNVNHAETAQAYNQIGTFLTGYFTELIQTIHASRESLIRFARAYGIPPCRFGTGPCFCHPKPFPVARDYRRRTKHRNRRRR